MSHRLLVLVIGLALAGACSKSSDPASTADPAAAAEAKKIFETRCTPCHGPEGRGNGPASATLTPPPRNFHEKRWQNQVTNEHIERIVQYGGSAVGKSAAMPANPDLGGKPAVVAALKDVIRGFGKN